MIFMKEKKGTIYTSYSSMGTKHMFGAKIIHYESDAAYKLMLWTAFWNYEYFFGIVFWFDGLLDKNNL